jgi:hypothetical protein
MLLKCQGVNVNATNIWSDTPLVTAVISRSRDVCRLLLEDDRIFASVNGIGGSVPPLHRAIEQGDIRIVEMLLERPDLSLETLDDDVSRLAFGVAFLPTKHRWSSRCRKGIRESANCCRREPPDLIKYAVFCTLLRAVSVPRYNPFKKSSVSDR